MPFHGLLAQAQAPILIGTDQFSLFLERFDHPGNHNLDLFHPLFGRPITPGFRHRNLRLEDAPNVVPAGYGGALAAQSVSDLSG